MPGSLVWTGRRRRLRLAAAPPIVGNTFYVSTSGLPTNTGAIGSPWSLVYALNGAFNGVGVKQINPADTVIVRGGAYVGQFSCSLSGVSNGYIEFKAFPGERVLIDGNVGLGSIGAPILAVNGNYTKWKGLEILNSDPIRVSGQNGSNPTDMNGRSQKTIRNTGKFNQFHNLLIHDTSNGIEDQSIATAEGSEWWGCWVWNVGWDGLSDRGHGHCLYPQNALSIKSFKDIVAWGAHDITVQFDGTSDTSIINFLMDNCALGYSGWHSGASSPQANIVIANADPTKCGATTFSNTDFFGLSGGVGSFGTQGVSPGSLPMIYSGNRSVGQPTFAENLGWTITGSKFSLGKPPAGGSKVIAVRRGAGQPYSDHALDNNTYCGVASDAPFYDVLAGVGTTRNFAAWQAGGWDAHSTFTDASGFTGGDSVVHSVGTEVGRGHIRCFNWGLPNVTGVAATDIFTKTAHGMANNTQVAIGLLTGGAGLALNTLYYVISQTANTFQLSLTQGGAAINFTTDVTDATVVPAALNVNLSSVLNVGDTYVIHHIYDLFGAPVVSGTYGGGEFHVFPDEFDALNLDGSWQQSRENHRRSATARAEVQYSLPAKIFGPDVTQDVPSKMMLDVIGAFLARKFVTDRCNALDSVNVFDESARVASLPAAARHERRLCGTHADDPRPAFGFADLNHSHESEVAELRPQ